MKDFSRDRKAIQFKIDDDMFDCRPALPADVLLDFTVKFDAVGEDDPSQSRDVLVSVLQEALVPDSFKRFRERMADPDNPIDMAQTNDVIEWVFTEYGLRPTRLSADSPTGQPNPASGTNSTESAPAVVSISVDSPSIAS